MIKNMGMRYYRPEVKISGRELCIEQSVVPDNKCETVSQILIELDDVDELVYQIRKKAKELNHGIHGETRKG